MIKNRFLIFILVLSLLFLSSCGNTHPSQEGEVSPTPTPNPNIPQDNLGYSIGKTMPDFTFTTCDGREMSLYSTLLEKELVAVNIWATWCNPCGMEFPYMEEAYQQYKDSVEIFALSCESNDSNAKLSRYASEKGMSFPVGRDSAGIASTFAVRSIPTTILIDRYGTICDIEVGAKFTTEAFTSLFERYVGDDYAAYVPPAAEAAPVCDLEPSSIEELTRALGGGDGLISFRNPDSDQIWPMLVQEYEGRVVAISSNAGLDNTAAAISADFSAKAGDVLQLRFYLSGEEAIDMMKIYVNGVLAKCFGGEKGWMSYALALQADGPYNVIIAYEKDSYGSIGEDVLILDSIELLSGAEAKAALDDNPDYVRAETTSFTVASPGARKIVFDDPQQLLLNKNHRSIYSFWIVPGGQAQLVLTPGEGVDPESLLFYSDYSGAYTGALSGATEEGYAFLTGVDSMDSSGYPYTTVYVEDTASGSIFRAAICFPDEENLEYFLSDLVDQEGNRLVSWSYDDGSTPSEVSYTVRYTDQNGAPVTGVVLQVCDESVCQVYTSDENGECRFTLAPYAYELHTLVLPDGYSGDTEGITIAPAEGGEIEFTVTKN